MMRMWRMLAEKVRRVLNACSELERENAALRKEVEEQKAKMKQWWERVEGTFTEAMDSAKKLEARVAELEAEKRDVLMRSAAGDVERCALSQRLAVLEKERPGWLARVPGSVQAAAERNGKYTAEERRRMARCMGDHPVVLANLDELQVTWWEYAAVAMNPSSSARQVDGAHGAMDALQLAMFQLGRLTGPMTEEEKLLERDRAALRKILAEGAGKDGEG